MDKAMLRSSRTELSRLMLGWFAAAHPSLSVEFTYAGEAESPDGKADVVDAKNADGFNARLFIDRETRLPLMVTYRGPQPRVVTAGGPIRLAAPPAAAGHGTAQQAPERREMTEEERKKARKGQRNNSRRSERSPRPRSNSRCSSTTGATSAASGSRTSCGAR